MSRDLNDLQLLHLVVEVGSLSAAARNLGVTPSSVSRRLTRLEAHYGMTLVHRGPRGLTPTEAGRRLSQLLGKMFEELDIAEANLSAESQAGRVRVSIPRDLAGLREPWLSFLAAHPDVELELMASNRYVNIMEEGYDATLRAGLPEDQSLVVTKVGEYSLHVVASPAYLDRRGTPTVREELAGHDAVMMFAREPPSPWLRPTRRIVGQPIRPRLVIDDLDLAIEAVLQGCGIGVFPTYVVADAVKDGRLRLLTDGGLPKRIPLYLVQPPQRWRSPAFDALLAHLKVALPEAIAESEAGFEDVLDR